MQKIFQFNNLSGKIELIIDEILLVKEFAKLIEPKRNICPDDETGEQLFRAFREFTYIWLALDWNSIFSDYLEQERHQESLKNSGLTEEEFNDPDFRAACRKYKELQNETRSIKLLQAARNTVDKFIDYFNNVDPEERDVQTGKPIFKVETLIKELSSLNKVHETLLVLEAQVKKELAEASSIRGGAEDGFLPNF